MNLLNEHNKLNVYEIMCGFLCPTFMSLKDRSDPLEWLFTFASICARSTVVFMRVAGILLVVLGLSLITLVSWIFAYLVLPLVTNSLVECSLHAILMVILLFNVFFNYTLAVSTNPGVIRQSDVSIRSIEEIGYSSENEREDIGEMEDQLLQTPRIRRTRAIDDPQVDMKKPSTPKFTYCRTCRQDRPERAHHCSVCNRCIENLDHHCPWLNNCVGRQNYRYFISFLIWLTIGAGYAAYMSFGPAYGNHTILKEKKLLQIAMSPLFQWFQTSPIMFFQFVFSMALAAGLAVFILGSWHIYLIATAQTSVEFQINRSAARRERNGGKIKSPYNRGTIHKNWELVFGPCQWKIISLLPSTRRPPIVTFVYDMEAQENDLLSPRNNKANSEYSDLV